MLFTRRLAERMRWSAPTTTSRSVGMSSVSWPGSDSRPSRRHRTRLLGLTSWMSSSWDSRTDAYVVVAMALFSFVRSSMPRTALVEAIRGMHSLFSVGCLFHSGGHRLLHDTPLRGYTHPYSHKCGC